jgi:hypothetical protein
MVFEAEIKQAAAHFAENVASGITQFQRLVPSDPNLDLTNRFLEAQVRRLVEERLAPKRLVSGTFSAPGAPVSETGSPVIEGAIYDPQRGPILLERGRFSIMNPATCAGVIQIKPSAANISKFQANLREIALTFFYGRRSNLVMGVLVSDAEPGKKSIVCRNGKKFAAYEFTNPKWCPIFILFSRRERVYEPYVPAIEAFLANLGRMVQSTSSRPDKP